MYMHTLSIQAAWAIIVHWKGNVIHLSGSWLKAMVGGGTGLRLAVCNTWHQTFGLLIAPLSFKHTVPTCENIAYLKGNVIHLLDSCLKCSIGSGAQGKLVVMDNRHKECGMPLNLLCEAWTRFHCMDKYNLVFIPELWLNAYITRETHWKHSRIYQNHTI